jgi:uncharacterized membrane protein YvbJ
MQDPLSHLDKIERVKTSPFLYAKILRKIENNITKIDKQEMVYWAIPCFAIIMFIVIIYVNPISNHTDTNDLASLLHLNNSYSLY